jgi:hypothetical protein
VTRETDGDAALRLDGLTTLATELEAVRALL